MLSFGLLQMRCESEAARSARRNFKTTREDDAVGANRGFCLKRPGPRSRATAERAKPTAKRERNPVKTDTTAAIVGYKLQLSQVADALRNAFLPECITDDLWVKATGKFIGRVLCWNSNAKTPWRPGAKRAKAHPLRLGVLALKENESCWPAAGCQPVAVVSAG